MSVWQRVRKAVTRIFRGGGGNASPSRRVANNRDSRRITSSNTSTANTSARRAYINAYKADRDDLVRDSRKDSWSKTRNAFKADTSKFEQREKAKKDTKDFFKATASKLPKTKSTSELVKSGDYEYIKPKNKNTKSADERPTLTPTMQAYKKRGVSKGESLARGVVKGASFGVSDKMLKGQTDTEKAREKYYQQNKSKGWETAGEIAGSLVSFGGVGKAGARTVGKLTATKAGKKLVAKTAESGLVRASARRSAKKAVEKGVAKKASQELIDEISKKKAERLVKGLGTDAFINATGGLVSDINRADENHKRFSDGWWEELGESAALNVALGGATEVVPALRNNKNIIKDSVENVAEGTSRNAVANANVKADINLPKKEEIADINNAISNKPKKVVPPKALETTVDETLRPTSVDDIVKENPPRNLAKSTLPKNETPSGNASRKIEDVVNKKRPKASNAEKLEKFTRSIRTKVADSLSAFEDEARAKRKTDYQGMLDDFGAINNVRSFGARAKRSIENTQVKWNGDRFENGTSLNAIFGDMDEKTEGAFDAYLALKHAPDRIREGKPVFDNMEGLEQFNDPEECLREADRLLKEHPEFAEKAEQVYQYTRNELQNRVDAGLLPQSVPEDWYKKYPYYVPTGRDGFFNEVHNIKGSVVGAGELKAAKGSDRAIRSIREQLEDATTRNWRDMSLNNLFRRMFGDGIANDLAKDADGGVERVLDNTLGLSKSKENGKYYADIYVDGEKKRVEIEKKFYDSLEDLYKNGRLGNGIDELNDIFSNYTDVFKNLITEWSPIFLVKNGMRDFPEAIINSRQTKEFLESMRPALADLLSDGQYSQALRDAGISQSTFIDIDKSLAKRGNKLIRANELVEMYPRLVEYMATFKKAGVDLKDADIALRNRAAANAADVTVNFGRNGSVGKALNKGFVPFFSPSVQGWSKFMRNLSEAEGSKQILSLFLKATALGAAPLAVSNFLYKDNPNYQMISARDKANNYIIAIPPLDTDNTNMFLKIPRSRFASVYGLPVVNLFNDNKMGVTEAIKVANDQVAPLDPIESNVFGAFAQARGNKTWYGTPIVPQSLEDLPKPEQYDANTSNLAIGLGKATEKLPEPLQISPKKAEYAIDAVTGVAGDFLLPMTTKSRQSGSKNPIVRYGYPAANVLKRQFSIDSVTQNDLSTRFYNSVNEANTKNKSQHGGEKEAEEYKRLDSYSTEISDINKAIKKIQGSKKATKQADIYGLQKVRNQLMQDALDGKDVPSSAKTLDAVQKYVGTSCAITNFGSTADKEAMKVYGLNKYGGLSEAQRNKQIDADKGFYKGVQSINRLDESIEKVGMSGKTTTLGKAVALASVDADNDLFDAYGAGLQGRTETASKKERAKTYLNDGGSTKEYVKLEKARKTLGKLSDYDESKEHEANDKRLEKGEISINDWKEAEKAIDYNANISYVGLATSFAQSNAPSRGYALYDIKAKNAQKGVNLAAMGYSARDYRNMVKDADIDGNGYLKTAEIRNYVANSGAEDKATLYDALYHYNGKYNPFGTPTNYTRAQAAAVGKANKVEQISNETGDLNLKDDNSSASTSSGYGSGYGGRRSSRRRGGGGGSSKTVKTSVPIKASDYKATKATYKDAAASLKTKSSSKKKTKAKATPTIKVEPPKVKFKKYTV